MNEETLLFPHNIEHRYQYLKKIKPTRNSIYCITKQRNDLDFNIETVYADKHCVASKSDMFGLPYVLVHVSGYPITVCKFVVVGFWVWE